MHRICIYQKRKCHNKNYGQVIYHDAIIAFGAKQDFQNVLNDTITFKYKTKEYQVFYWYIKHECEQAEFNSDMQYLLVELDGKNKNRVAEVLDAVHHSIFSHDEKANYDIIASYDGISKYCCDRVHPLLN